MKKVGEIIREGEISRKKGKKIRRKIEKRRKKGVKGKDKRIDELKKEGKKRK
jgi:hypothetical protein